MGDTKLSAFSNMSFSKPPHFGNRCAAPEYIEEHADLCVENRTKFFFEKHTKGSDKGELLDIAQNNSETKGNYDQNQLMLDIKKVLRDCEMDRENELQIHVRRGFCFVDFLKTFRKPYNAKKKSYRYIVTIIENQEQTQEEFQECSIQACKFLSVSEKGFRTEVILYVLGKLTNECLQ